MEGCCSVCGVATTKRCGRCKAVLFCGTECQRTAWNDHRALCTSKDFLSAAQLEQLRRSGWCVVRLDGPTHALFQRLLTVWPLFFRRTQREKDAFKTPSLRGTYMTPEPGLHECFEHKRSHRDPAFRCPAECAEATEAVFQWCESFGLAVLRQLVTHAASAAGRGRTFSWERAGLEPDATLRVLHYDRVTSAVPMAELDRVFATHTDSSLLTLAPRSTLAALEMRRFDSGAWECVEDGMQPDDLVVFMGDAGAYLTNNYFPSPLHRASPARMLAAAGSATRISTPFFLRAAPHVALAPGDVTGCALPPLTVEQLDNNVGGCRDRFPWKLTNAYYAQNVYSE